jgi:Sigma-70, region 4
VQGNVPREMATFDQLPAEQRAIIELVVARGRSYDALADVLQVSPQRVRELARDALVELSPVTGERVDPQWRGQVADYLLGQQSGAESTATRAHLKRSEPARTWALSLLDALEMLYENGNRPAIPEPEAPAPERARTREAEDRDEEPTEEERPRERERERARRERPAAAVAETRQKEPEREERETERERDADRDRDREERPVARRSVLSPAAQSALRRRRIFAAVAAVVVVAAIVVGVLAITGAFSSDDNSAGSASTNTTASTTPAGSSPTQVLGLQLKPVGNVKASGAAYVAQQGGKQLLEVVAKLPPLPKSQKKAAYNVWLYNSPKDAQSVGAQFTTPQGDYQGVGPLPANYKRFRFIDVSVQTLNKTTAHSGNSVLRGPLSALQPVPTSAQGTPPATGGTQTAPTP